MHFKNKKTHLNKLTIRLKTSFYYQASSLCFQYIFMHRLQLKLIAKTSVNVLIWNVHCRDWHICASAGIHPQTLGNMHHCVQLHNMLKGIIQNCSLKNT